MTEQQPIEPSEAPQSGEGPAPSEGLQQAEPTEDPQVDTSPFEPPDMDSFLGSQDPPRREHEQD